MRRPSRRTWIGIATLAGVLALVAGTWYRREVRPEWSPVGRGEQIAQAAGCFACHGRSEAELRANFRRTPSGDWRARGIPTFWSNGLTEAEAIEEWIVEGCPPAERERHEQLFVQMPPYQRFLPPEEIDAITAWILAQGLHLAHAATPADPGEIGGDGRRTEEELVREGDRLSRAQGCYQCHGELGQGGVSNAASFKGYIPGFFGADFRALTHGGEREEILHWIDHGRGRAIEAGFLGTVARSIFDRQAIGMPAYQDRLTAPEKELLADYLLWLNARGPLDARAVEALARQLNGETDDSP